VANDPENNSIEAILTAPWGRFVEWLGAPADAEANRLGIKDNNERNAFGHAYTAALIAHGYLGMPISHGKPARAFDLVDVLGRAEEDLPGIFGRQTDFADYYRDLWNNGVGADIGNYARSHLYAREELGRLIERYPDDVRCPISKATLYLYHLDDLEEALRSIDLALQRAHRTGFFRREALGNKARILLQLGSGRCAVWCA
jgi:hypothetical protein